MRSDASPIGGIVKLLFELSVHLHEPATFLNDNGELLSHVAYTVAVQGRCLVWLHSRGSGIAHLGRRASFLARLSEQ
jgi:hypothetical protein